MSKINILVVPPDTNAVGHFRYIEPHLELQKKYSEEFYVDIDVNPNWVDERFISRFNIIILNHIALEATEEDIIEKYQKMGIKIIADIDDYWLLSNGHILYGVYRDKGYSQKITNLIKKVDYVTTTTSFLADEIKKYNTNVFIFPNAIDPTMKRNELNPVSSERVRIGYMGGSTHYRDLSGIKSFFSTLVDKYSNKTQQVLCGFNLNAIVTDMDEYGRPFKRKEKPHESIWVECEKIFTSNYRGLPNDYKKHLLKYNKDDYNGDVDNYHYRRINNKPFSAYMSNYSYFDIAIAPLENIKFNNMKSQLKVIEAGFAKLPIMCSDIKPYQIDIKNGINGILVNDRSNKGWSYHIKSLIESENYRKDMGEKLYETVKDEYDLRNVTKGRYDFYKNLKF